MITDPVRVASELLPATSPTARSGDGVTVNGVPLIRGTDLSADAGGICGYGAAPPGGTCEWLLLSLGF